MLRPPMELPSTSYNRGTAATQATGQIAVRETPEQKTEKIIRDAEAMKIRVLQTPGKELNQFNQEDLHNEEHRVYSSIIDEDYMVLTNHVDQVTQDKIKKGEYMDFAKLIPRDRVLLDEDCKMQLV